MVQETTAGRMSDGTAGKKVIGGVIWALGCYMTAQFLIQASGSSGMAVYALAITVQGCMTLCESPIWRGKATPLAAACLIGDAIINLAGVNAWLHNIDGTASIRLISEAFGVENEWTDPVRLLVMMVVSAAIAGLPEALWKKA